MQTPKLFIGNVKYETRIETIVEMFSQHGTVVDSYKPEGKGFAFITMSSTAEAEAAMNALNETDVDGRKIFITESQPKPKSPRA